MSLTPTDLIFTLCFEADITIAELSRRTGIHEDTLCKITSLDKIPSDRTMKALERYLAERKARATPDRDGP